jgi:TIR domain
MKKVHIVTLCEGEDRPMRKALDRYLMQLSKNSDVSVWNEDDVPPGEQVESIVQEQLKRADVVLLLLSQDFWASDRCYKQAQTALQWSLEQPQKKIVPIMLRPNSIDDTPFKDYARLPTQHPCISQYKDPEQGYWDTWQGIKTLLNPAHRYQKRPKILTLEALLTGTGMFLLACIFILLLPLIYPQKGVRIVPEPFRGGADTTIYYKIYKLDKAPQPNVMLSFSIAPDDTLRHGRLYPYAYISKEGDENWNNGHPVLPHDLQMVIEKEIYYSQCVALDLREGDEGAYRFHLEFNKPLDAAALHSFRKRLACRHDVCSITESNCENVQYFSAFHRLYFLKNRLYTAMLMFILTGILLYLFMNIKKTVAYA